MIKDPCFAGELRVRRCDRLVQETIDVKPHDVRLPLDGEGVEIVGKLLTIRQSVGRPYAVPARVTWSMKGAVNYRRFFPDVFHDVDFAAIGPACRIYIVAQHPKGRPEALTVRNLNSRLKPSVGLAELILREQSRRSVITIEAIGTGKTFFERFDNQEPTFEIRVRSPARIGLKLVVAPAIPANIEGPLARINRGAVGTIELVGPHQAPNRGIAGIRCWAGD